MKSIYTTVYWYILVLYFTESILHLLRYAFFYCLGIYKIVRLCITSCLCLSTSSSRRHRLEVISQSVWKVKEQPSSRLVICLTCTVCADVDVRHRTWRVLIDAPISGRPALFLLLIPLRTIFVRTAFD